MRIANDMTHMSLKPAATCESENDINDIRSLELSITSDENPQTQADPLDQNKWMFI